jgi:NitT/TauT family transport system permease protein
MDSATTAKATMAKDVPPALPDDPPVTAVADTAPSAPLDPVDDTGTAARAHPAVSPGTGIRGRRPSRFFGIRNEIGVGWQIAFGIGGVAVILVGWQLLSMALSGGTGASLVPSPARTLSALAQLWSDGTLQNDLVASMRRIAIGYSISVAIGIVFGLLIGTFATVQAFFEPQFGFLRYIPATALTPVFMLWLGIGENSKIWLIVVGTMFFNILMVADVVRGVPRELINASYTLGAGRLRILRKVLLPHSVPGIIDVARINLAAAWLMLVVAELLAAQEGLAYQILKTQRFRAVDRMFAILIVFGIIGIVSDLCLRVLRDRVAPWNRP